uniref:Uncharacterized protein n=1 Tax=Lepeophtheirus salmonis TaxID=72036 RepID=A0A0K2TCG9_LEPSM
MVEPQLTWRERPGIVGIQL